MSKNNVDPCGVCRLSIKANSILLLQCSKWIHGRCGGLKRITIKFHRNVSYRKCELNIGKAVEQKEKLSNEVETVRESTNLGSRMSAGNECEAAESHQFCMEVNHGA